MQRCQQQLPEFGRFLGCDGKALPSYARRSGKSDPEDRRGEHDARWGAHTHRSRGSDGAMRETEKRSFGFKLHPIADTRYELPIAFGVLPAIQNGMPVSGSLHGRLGIRIPPKENRRIFSPVARSSYRWKRLYNKRSALERINNRIDTSFGFERHTIRGLKKMSILATLSLSLMLNVAIGRTAERQPHLIRNLSRTG